MKKLHFSTLIDAPKEKVWHAMLDDKSYRVWTSAFSPGSYYKGDWSKGSKMLFLGPDPETGQEGGMVSRIAENRPYEHISIEHIGIIKNGIKDTTSKEATQWSGALENYTLKERDGKTEVLVDLESAADMDPADEYTESFGNMWRDGLNKLKELAEA